MGNLSYNLEKLLLVDCFEVRTTVHKKLLSFDDLMQLKKDWTEEHVDNWYLQQYHEAECYDSTLNHTETYSNAELSDMAKCIGSKNKRYMMSCFTAGCITVDPHDTSVSRCTMNAWYDRRPDRRTFLPTTSRIPDSQGHSGAQTR